MSEQVLQGGYAPVNYVRKKKPIFRRLSTRREELTPVMLAQKPAVAPVPVENSADISDDLLHSTGLGDLSLDHDVVTVRPNENAQVAQEEQIPEEQDQQEFAREEEPYEDDTVFHHDRDDIEELQLIEDHEHLRDVKEKEKKNFLDIIKADADKSEIMQPPVGGNKKQIQLEYEETPAPVYETEVFEDDLDEQEVEEAIATADIEQVEAADIDAAEVKEVLEDDDLITESDVAPEPAQPSADKLAEFYDLNVKEFAALPTAEFIKKYREYSDLVEAVTAIEGSLTLAKSLASAARDTVNIGKYGADFQQNDRQYVKAVYALYELASAGEFENKPGSLREIHEADNHAEAAKKFLYGSLLPKLEVRDRRLVAIAHDKAVIDRFVELSKIIEESRLDRTPRQNIDTIAEFFDTIVADIEAEVPQAQQRLDNFRTKYHLRVEPIGKTE